MDVGSARTPTARRLLQGLAGLAQGLAVGFVSVGLVPGAVWLGCAVYAWRASRHLGRWPGYGNPDPEQLPAGFDAATAGAEWVVPAVVGIGAAVLIVRWVWRTASSPGGRLYLAVTVSLTLWAAFLALAALDPGGVLNWILD